MYIIQQITSAPYQQLSLGLQDGTSLTMTIYWSQQQQGWFITNLTYNNFVVNGLRITVCPNFLNQFRNLIPFGMGCFSIGNREPSLQQDFSSGNCVLYLLSKAEINEYAELLSQGPQS